MKVKKYHQLFSKSKQDELIKKTLYIMIKNDNVGGIILLLENKIIKKKEYLKSILDNLYNFFREKTFSIKDLEYLIELLLKNGLKANDRDKDKYTLLMNALIISKKAAFLCLKMDNQIDLTLKNNNNDDIFEFAKNFSKQTQSFENDVKINFPKIYNKYLRHKNMNKFNI